MSSQAIRVDRSARLFHFPWHPHHGVRIARGEMKVTFAGRLWRETVETQLSSQRRRFVLGSKFRLSLDNLSV